MELKQLSPQTKMSGKHTSKDWLKVCESEEYDSKCYLHHTLLDTVDGFSRNKHD